MPVVASPGNSVGLSSILTSDFGAWPNGWSDLYLAYYSVSQIQGFNFSFWNSSSPAAATWFVNGTDIGGFTGFQTYVPANIIGTTALRAGNDIGPYAYLTVPADTSGAEYIQYSIITVDPNLLSPVAGHGAPTAQDIVDTAYRFASFYGSVYEPRECHNIAEAVAAATGATLPYLSGSIDPTQNEEGGFWRIVYRGSDPSPVSNWQTLVRPGDIVRMGWNNNDPEPYHTTTVLHVNSDGTMVVYDNSVTGFAAVRTVTFDTGTKPQTITIYRLTTDGLYLEQGSDLGESLHGTLFNDHILGKGGDDVLSGGPGNDVLEGGDGFNSAAYTGQFTQYQFVQHNDGTLTVADIRTGSPEGTDQLKDIQRLTFADRIETAPVASAANKNASHNQNIAAAALFSVSDAQNDTAVRYQLWDSTSDSASGYWLVNGIAQGANIAIDVSATQIASTTFQSRSGTDLLYVRASDGILWGDWKAFTVTGPVDQPPIVVASNVTATHGQASVAASSLFSASDPEGDTISKYAFWDTEGNGHWSINAVTQATNVEIDVASANLSQVSYVFGSATDTLYVRAFDGLVWGAWKAFTATPAANHAPVVTASDFSATHNQNIAASSLISVADADNDTITAYRFWDSTTDATSGHFVVGGVAQGTNQNIDVSAAQLSSATFQSGAVSDDLWVQAFDGIAWSAWKEFHVNPPVNHAPVATASDFSATHNQNIAAGSLFSVTDADSDTITKYQVWDSTTDPASGHWVLNGVTQGTNVAIDVTAAQLASTTFQSGGVSDDLWVRGFDGTVWSNWKEFYVKPPINHAPVATASDFSATHNQNIAATNLFSVTDADNDSMTAYHFWDSTTDATSGHFVVGGIAQGANQNIDVSAAQLSNTTFQSGAVSDDLWIQAFDGVAWSAWKEFHVNQPINHAPVATASDFSATHNQNIAATSLFSVTDADNDSITAYRFSDQLPTSRAVISSSAGSPRVRARTLMSAQCSSPARRSRAEQWRMTYGSRHLTA